MSIKFRKDGATFPTSVSDGVLTVYMGDDSFTVEIPFINKEYPYDNSSFPVSNVMCYLDNGDEKVVILFDGSVTRYTSDMCVVGFMKFDIKNIYNKITTLNVGCVRVPYKGKTILQPCALYLVQGSTSLTLECMNDPEPICFKAEENEAFLQEVVRGTRYFPVIVNVGPNSYTEDNGAYEIVGYPLKITGYSDI